jgi:RNA polymerase sigma-70 factor (ECF subfamily)
MAESLNGSLERIYREYRQRLYTYALSITGCPERAEDAVQEAFCRLQRFGARPEAPAAYVFRAVRNAAFDDMRRNPPAAAASDGEGDWIFDPRPDPAEASVDREFAQRAARALRELSEDEREAIVLHLYGDLTFREIAELRDAPLGTVTTWYRRGLEKLRSIVGE